MIYQITSNSHNLRSQADGKSTILAVLQTGTRFSIVGKTGTWLEVKTVGQEIVSGYLMLTNNLSFKLEDTPPLSNAPDEGEWVYLAPAPEIRVTSGERDKIGRILVAIGNGVLGTKATITPL